MDFGKKLQALRKQKGLTQEELAKSIYVSRTAVSKWESGRGTPSIESLKAIAKFFSVTVDELLSSDEILTIAENDRAKTVKHYRDLIFGLVDICALLLLVLPLFATKADGSIVASSLITLDGVQAYLMAIYYVVTLGSALTGILILALQNLNAAAWVKIKTSLSFAFSLISVFVFVISSQPYAAIFCFVLLIIKAFMLIKKR